MAVGARRRAELGEDDGLAPEVAHHGRVQQVASAQQQALHQRKRTAVGIAREDLVPAEGGRVRLDAGVRRPVIVEALDLKDVLGRQLLPVGAGDGRARDHRGVVGGLGPFHPRL